jgi:1,3-alpha-isomaltosidase
VERGRADRDRTVIPTFRRFVRLRERLVPYVAREGERAIETGKPLMRGLCFETRDERLWLPAPVLPRKRHRVAPVVEPGVTEQQVFLPDVSWVNAWTGEEVAGGKTVTAETPIEQLPAYLASARADMLAPRLGRSCRHRRWVDRMCGHG